MNAVETRRAVDAHEHTDTECAACGGAMIATLTGRTWFDAVTGHYVAAPLTFTVWRCTRCGRHMQLWERGS